MNTIYLIRVTCVVTDQIDCVVRRKVCEYDLYRQIYRTANTLLKHKVLFGSDYPLIRPERWMKDFDQLEVRDEVKPLVMKQNAIKALGLR